MESVNQMLNITEKDIEFHKGYKKGSKETAEKFLDKVDNESNGQTKQITDLLRKQLGVKIKEQV